jgi:hypothetical protein
VQPEGLGKFKKSPHRLNVRVQFQNKMGLRKETSGVVQLPAIRPFIYVVHRDRRYRMVHLYITAGTSVKLLSAGESGHYYKLLSRPEAAVGYWKATGSLSSEVEVLRM